jgi:hypothetical protein
MSPPAAFTAQPPSLQRVADVPEASQTAPPPAASLAGRVAEGLVRRRGLLFLLAILLVASGVERARQLKFSRSIDAMFDRSDPAIVPFNRMARTFGGGEVVLCAYDDPELFTAAGIDRLAVLTKRLAVEPGVQAAMSLASTPLGRRIIATDESPAARRIVAAGLIVTTLPVLALPLPWRPHRWLTASVISFSLS